LVTCNRVGHVLCSTRNWGVTSVEVVSSKKDRKEFKLTHGHLSDNVNINLILEVISLLEFSLFHGKFLADFLQKFAGKVFPANFLINFDR